MMSTRASSPFYHSGARRRREPGIHEHRLWNMNSGFRFAAPRFGERKARACVGYTDKTEILRAVERDQRKTRFRVLLLAQMRWGLRQDDFEGRAHMAFEEMTADNRAVRLPEHGVDVQDRLAGGFGALPDPRQRHDLLVDRHAPLGLRVPIE